ncbi:WhiB family transcriptional regulator [Streptomyces sp. NPDC017991]|uniref:WhiB family transcriptional regulator n=1 Tax=Streptomyces sp. NPDC017991 TaxID=3365026 RepID=UPI0037B76CC1
MPARTLFAVPHVPFPRSSTPTACHARPDLFIPDREMGSQEDLDRIHRAKSMCSTCPVIEDCLKWALVNPDLAAEGIWAATTPRERTRLVKLIRRPVCTSR